MNMDGQGKKAATDESEAIHHAQEYIRLVISAACYADLDRTVLEARGYFQSLVMCGLICSSTQQDLDRQVLAIADSWQPPGQY